MVSGLKWWCGDAAAAAAAGAERMADQRTCWHRYERLRGPRRTAARTRWRPCARTEGSHRRWPSYVPDQRYGSWGREHHG